MLSSVSPIELSRETKFVWLIFIFVFILTVLTCRFTYSTINDMFNSAKLLDQKELDCEKIEQSCNYYLEAYNKLYSTIQNENLKYSLSMEIIKYENLKKENQLDKELLNEKTKKYIENIKEKKKKMITIALLSIIFLYLTLALIFETLKRQYINSKIYYICQSCGRSINSILMNYGTEKDSTFSRSFCNKCYNNGKYTNPNITIEEMKDKVKKEMENKKIPLSVINRKIEGIKKLKRWIYANKF